MRILPIPETVNTASPAPEPAAAPQDSGRMDMLEKIAASILKRLNDIDERMTALEKATPAVTPEIRTPDPVRVTSPAHITLDTEAVKKNLMTKMWTYLNDKAA